MGHQIIKQPDGKYALFSSVVDGFTMIDATREELAGYFGDKSRAELEKSVAQKCNALDNGERPYAQFTMTYEEALAEHVKNHGALSTQEGE